MYTAPLRLESIYQYSSLTRACVKDPCSMSRSLRHQAKATRPNVWSFEPQHQHYNAPIPMIRTCARASFRSRTLNASALCVSAQWLSRRQFSGTISCKEDPRIESMGREIIDEFAVIRQDYGQCLKLTLKCLLTPISNTSLYTTSNATQALTRA